MYQNYQLNYALLQFTNFDRSEVSKDDNDWSNCTNYHHHHHQDF